ncbi:hypothetical protein GWN26_00055 [Candidatus Saccharibacteria bacterium]|nr:hypothetical protein [Candidatus Saccharibacteria bacterium]NIV03074.1 hypothetical protein [Calditrichia bacterium]NIS37603.1 hypothetical protein [Candidatus Saccharibacteria bacterium]NIV71170.1 hypothetical protein [Calditrichia bacterium]NIV97618.1 hypothetical protein [Candidatus Saccharibacteria bacterium]
MHKIISLLSIIALVVLMGVGCLEIKTSPEEAPIAVPSDEVKAPTPEDIGEEDIFEDEEEDGVSELDVLVEEVETIEAEAEVLFKDFKNIDTSQDDNLNL